MSTSHVSEESDSEPDEMEQQTRANTITNRMPPPPDRAPVIAHGPLQPPRQARVQLNVQEKDTNSTSPNTPPVPPAPPAAPAPPSVLQHFSYTCPGLHDVGSRTLVERWTFSRLLDPQSALRVVIPLFQRTYCWNTTTTVPAWWRDTANSSSHSCGKLMFKQHYGAWWCLDGQQRVTTTLLLIAAARDALLRLQHKDPHVKGISEAIFNLESVLFVDVPAAHTFATSNTRICAGQRLLFSRLVPSFCDRQHFFELIIGGVVAGDGTDAWLSDTTLHSIQFDTKHYFDVQFQCMLDNASTGTVALNGVMSRAEAALHMQLMMVELQSTVNLAQVYQWLQEKSLISMGALLFNPSPGMTMHACDLTRNLFLSPWVNESLEEQEHQHSLQWLVPIEVPCRGSPAKIDNVLRKVLERYSSVHQSETESRLVAVANSPGFNKQDLSGLLLYGRVLTFWERQAEALQDSISDAVLRQRHVATKIMKMMTELTVEV